MASCNCAQIAEFKAWAAARTTPATAEAIRARFDVSRATAYRWLRRIHKAQVSA